jgi:hypothetical protein
LKILQEQKIIIKPSFVPPHPPLHLSPGSRIDVPLFGDFLAYYEFSSFLCAERYCSVTILEENVTVVAVWKW